MDGSEEKIVLVPHDSNWAVSFSKEKFSLLEQLGSAITTINHVGSTAITTISAKPIIDIVIESEFFPPSDAILQTLLSLGYEPRGESGVSGRYWLTKGKPRQFNLHWCPVDGDVPKHQITFRNALIANELLAKEYEVLKMGAAHGQSIDSAEYANAKTEFVRKVLRA